MQDQFIMDVIKVTAGLAVGFLIALLGLIVFMENPMQEDYKEAVESIMINEGLSSVQEVLDAFPDVEDIKSNMDRIACLKRDIHALTAGPAPNVSTEEMLLIDAYKNEIVLLQKSVNEKLTRLKSTYAVAGH